MVGYGEYLRAVSAEHGVSAHAIDYDGLKALVDATRASLRRASRTGSRRRASSGASETRSDAASASSHESLGHDDSAHTDESSVEDSRAAEVPLTTCCKQRFTHKLERELRRLDDVIAGKLLAVLRRAHAVAETARIVRGRRLEADCGIVITQLVSVYDDVVLLLWFMYLNAIGVSKIVKKFNKHVAEPERYVLRPQQWVFLSSGLARSQQAKQLLEEEYTAIPLACKDEDGGSCGGAESGLTACDAVRALTDGVQRLISENSHHLHLSDDPTTWAIDPRIDAAPEPRAEPAGDNPASALRQRRRSLADPELRRRFVVHRVLGRGAYGTVTLVTDRVSKAPLALKTVRDVWTHPVLAQRACRETLILHQLSHPNIVPFAGVFPDQNKKDIHIALKYVAHTLESLIAAKRLVPVHRQWFLTQLLDALAYMHCRGVVHRDLKPSNLLVDDQPQLLVADFGLSRTVHQGATASHSTDTPDYVQTLWYRAPEVLFCSQESTPAADCWSAGCVLAELLTGVPIFPGQDTQHQLELIVACVGCNHVSGKEPAAASPPTAVRPAALPAARRGLQDVLRVCWRAGAQPDGGTGMPCEDAVDLLSRLLRAEPGQRISAAAGLQHPWLRHLRRPVHYPRGLEEGPVRIGLRCDTLYDVSRYRKAVHGGFHAEAEFAAVVTVQRWWRWTKGGRRGAPPRPLGGLLSRGSVARRRVRFAGVDEQEAGCSLCCVQ